MIFQRLSFSILTVAILSGCNGKKDDKKIVAAPVDMLTSQQWCAIEQASSAAPSIVTRYSFVRGDKNIAKIEYIRIDENDSPVLYKLSRDFAWKPKEADSYISLLEYTVELRSNPMNTSNLSNQVFLLEKIAKDHPKLSVLSSQNFKPAHEISIKHSNFLSGGDSEQLFYPCRSFGKAFEFSEQPSPTVEFQIYLGQLFVQADYDTNRNQLARIDALNLPIKQRKVEDLISSTESWCARFEFGGGLRYSSLKVLTFKNDKFILSNISDDWLRNPNRSEITADVLTRIVADDRVFSVLENDILVRGESKGSNNIGNQASPFDFKESFAAVEDALGVQALVKVNPYYPENATAIHFRDTYFKCGSDRDEYFIKKLNIFIEAQKSRLL